MPYLGINFFKLTNTELFPNDICTVIKQKNQTNETKEIALELRYSPWDGCSVNNCRLTYKSSDLHSVDAVVFHMHRTTNAASLPERRNLKQRWIFLSDESPINTFLNRRENVVADYNGMFNWTMTYRMNSDVPVPYGRTVPIANSNELPDESEFWVEEKWLPGGRERKLAAVLGSNCGGNNNRWKYVKELKKIFGI